MRSATGVPPRPTPRDGFLPSFFQPPIFARDYLIFPFPRNADGRRSIDRIGRYAGRASAPPSRSQMAFARFARSLYSLLVSTSFDICLQSVRSWTFCILNKIRHLGKKGKKRDAKFGCIEQSTDHIIFSLRRKQVLFINFNKNFYFSILWKKLYTHYPDLFFVTELAPFIIIFFLFNVKRKEQTSYISFLPFP